MQTTAARASVVEAPTPTLALDQSPAPPAGVESPLAWRVHCAPCHGMWGHADTAMGKRDHARDLTERSWQRERSNDEIRAVITRGQEETRMKSFAKKLTPAEIDELVIFIRRLEN